MSDQQNTDSRMRHPITGRFMAGDCERDCLEHCAGICGADGPRNVSDNPLGSE